MWQDLPSLRSLLISYLIHDKESSRQDTAAGSSGKESRGGMAGEEGSSGSEEASSMNAHRLIQYFFLDVASALESQQGANNAGPSWADVNGVDHLRQAFFLIRLSKDKLEE